MMVDAHLAYKETNQPPSHSLAPYTNTAGFISGIHYHIHPTCTITSVKSQIQPSNIHILTHRHRNGEVPEQAEGVCERRGTFADRASTQTYRNHSFGSFMGKAFPYVFHRSFKVKQKTRNKLRLPTFNNLRSGPFERFVFFITPAKVFKSNF